MTEAARLGFDRVPDTHGTVRGGIIGWREGTYYKISEYDLMDPFLISVVSGSDLWMYVSSTGGLAAGRRDPSRSLFPYETVDRLHRSSCHTGPTTIVRCSREGAEYLWEPFSPDGRLRYEIDRAVYKHELGCELWFEETNRSLGLTFRYGWRPSERFGWVRTAEIERDRDAGSRLAILDGVRNLLPAGVSQALQESASCLVDAYKKSEYDASNGIAVYRLAARIVDRAVASEALTATVAWQSGFDASAPALDPRYRERFMRGGAPPPRPDFNGRSAAFLLIGVIEPGSGAKPRWHIALDSPVDHIGFARLAREERSGAAVEADIRGGRDRLRDLLAGADALQRTGDRLSSAHHLCNVLFNVARGGVPPDNYTVERDDFLDFLKTRNRPVAERHGAWIRALPGRLPHADLTARAETAADANLLRLCHEYLPLVFSRRHGDPSRPWNTFSIAMTNPDGSRSYRYQGNWRDIFQNWEALVRSYPEMIEPIISKFVNASTLDGFNPYRITRDGIDWEIGDPEDPWSSIGYWGDHQIVYLLKLLEASRAHHPGRLTAMLDRDLFSYADVPYDMRPYHDIVADPQRTIDFDRDRQRATEERVERTGTDGRLVHLRGEVLHVNLAEKLLVPILAKLSSLVPGAGIWMNTMRPEWNDANNALVGNGVSVVTACHLFRHLAACAGILEQGPARLRLAASVAVWLDKIAAAIAGHESEADDEAARRSFMDRAGIAFSEYRGECAGRLGERVEVEAAGVVSALRDARRMLGETIRANRRGDGLYHSYNILHLGDATASIDRLPLMLEGQVAALDSGLLEPSAAAGMLGALRNSGLYREDQRSYLLYPVKTLPDFSGMNRVPDSIFDRSPRLKRLFDGGDASIVSRDASGRLRFHSGLHNAEALGKRLEGFPDAEAEAVLAVYEEVFRHKSFTGRSGTMYGYEGIGCIYWHMVAKLLLSVQGLFMAAREGGGDPAAAAALRERYYDIRAGLGFMKTPAEFGAFPLDPYSHTPGFGGARQPGMTGQVKEEILARWGELGVGVDGGTVSFRPVLLRGDEYLTGEAVFEYVDAGGRERSLRLCAGSLAFTFCQVPVVYTRSGDSSISVRYAGGEEETLEGDSLPADISARLFARDGGVERITVRVPS